MDSRSDTDQSSSASVEKGRPDRLLGEQVRGGFGVVIVRVLGHGEWSSPYLVWGLICRGAALSRC
jgi:hypothetical protein